MESTEGGSRVQTRNPSSSRCKTHGYPHCNLPDGQDHLPAVPFQLLVQIRADAGQRRGSEMWGCSHQKSLSLGLVKNHAHGAPSTAKDSHEHENELIPENNEEKRRFTLNGVPPFVHQGARRCRRVVTPSREPARPLWSSLAASNKTEKTQGPNPAIAGPGCTGVQAERDKNVY